MFLILAAQLLFNGTSSDAKFVISAEAPNKRDRQSQDTEPPHPCLPECCRVERGFHAKKEPMCQTRGQSYPPFQPRSKPAASPPKTAKRRELRAWAPIGQATRTPPPLCLVLEKQLLIPGKALERIKTFGLGWNADIDAEIRERYLEPHRVYGLVRVEPWSQRANRKRS